MQNAHDELQQNRKILTLSAREEEKFLRTPTKEFDFAAVPIRERRLLIEEMRKIMKRANGIGLAANQIGLDRSVFVAQVPDAQGKIKFYAIFNPKIVKQSNEKSTMEEGCLSVPGIYGEVTRPARVVLEGYTKEGKKIKIKAWGLLAKVFQHEVDHLNGKLFIDRAKNMHQIASPNDDQAA
ncbi:peptide deformylase [Candidatus Parcubacteria bacterium]|nr:MAG: peptide deformylase [Candidatus Parcubacteria bacterium]